MKNPQFSTNQQEQHSNYTKRRPRSQEQIPTKKVPNNRNHQLQIARTKTARNMTKEIWITTQTQQQRTKGNYTNVMEVFATAAHFPHIFQFFFSFDLSKTI